MDFRKLITRYKQFGGFRLLREYAKLGALGPALKAGIRCLVKRQSFKGIYPDVLRKIEPFLIKKYGTQIPQIAQRIKANTNLPNDTNDASTSSTGSGPESGTEKKTIWWCWLQGIENAPSIVRACYNSLVQGEWFKDHGYTVSVIDAQNWKKYIELPGYIVEKWEKGRIPAAMFSDLLRVELLIKYGGTWIDSTVLCTGFGTQKSQISRKEETNTNLTNYTNSSQLEHQLATDSKLSTLRSNLFACLSKNSQLKHFMNAPLFVFQYTRQGSVPVSISNWFISACQNNEVLMVLREMLYAYWKDYDCVLDYYIFHLFFAMISKEYPEQMAAMPYAQSQNSLVLLHHWDERFEQGKWDKLTSQVCFHKLAFRVSDEVKNDQGNYYNHILKEYGCI